MIIGWGALGRNYFDSFRCSFFVLNTVLYALRETKIN